MIRFFYILKAACFAFFWVAVTPATGQKYNWKKAIAPASFSVFSGATWGLHETLSHHYGRFQSRFPKANSQFWNPHESWKNKYQNGIPEQGPAFPGSTTVFVGLTDAKHPIATLHRISTIGIGVSIVLGEKKPAWHYALDAGISAASFGLGFHGVYSLFFKK